MELISSVITGLASGHFSNLISKIPDRLRESEKGKQAILNCSKAGFLTMAAGSGVSDLKGEGDFQKALLTFLDRSETADQFGQLFLGRPLDRDRFGNALARSFLNGGFDRESVEKINWFQAVNLFESAFLATSAFDAELKTHFRTFQNQQQNRLLQENGKALQAIRKGLENGRQIHIEQGEIFINQVKVLTKTLIDHLVSPSLEWETDSEILGYRDCYLNNLLSVTRDLSLGGLDRRAAREKSPRFRLDVVYTALRTKTLKEDDERMTDPSVRKESESFSALDMLNDHSRLVLLGDPGSGKSTFVNFLTLCMVSEWLKHDQAGIHTLTQGLSDKDGESKTQRWHHSVLLPLRVELRDLFAKVMPEVGEKVHPSHLEEFVASGLKDLGCPDYTSYLFRELRERGGLVLFDGLDEVSQADQHRDQIRRLIEEFAGAYPRCRILVTSRTFAYRQQNWRLNGFIESELSPFSPEQVMSFVTGWYREDAQQNHYSEQDAAGKAKALQEALKKTTG